MNAEPYTYQERIFYRVAKEFKMCLNPPYWPEDRNGWVFDTLKMNEDCTWIRHTFYLIESVEECLAHKLLIHQMRREE